MTNLSDKPIKNIALIIWIGIVLMLGLFAIILTVIGRSSGGEQIPIVLLSYGLGPLIWIYLAFATLISILFRKLFKYYWFLILIILMTTILIYVGRYA